MKLRDKNRGFTLWEVLVAVLILAVTLSGALLLVINCVVLNDANRSITLAYSALQTKMEEIKNIPFNNISVGNEAFDLTGFSSDKGKGKKEISNVTINNITSRRVLLKACFKSRNRLYGDNITDCQNNTLVNLTTYVW